MRAVLSTLFLNLIESLSVERVRKGRWQATPAVMRTHQAHYVGRSVR